MIGNIIEFSIRNRFVVILLSLGVVIWGVHSVINTPVDAIPDLSENQVIVFTDWMGRSPKEIEDQITYPLDPARHNASDSCEERDEEQKVDAKEQKCCGQDCGQGPDADEQRISCRVHLDSVPLTR